MCKNKIKFKKGNIVMQHLHVDYYNIKWNTKLSQNEWLYFKGNSCCWKSIQTENPNNLQLFHLNLRWRTDAVLIWGLTTPKLLRFSFIFASSSRLSMGFFKSAIKASAQNFPKVYEYNIQRYYISKKKLCQEVAFYGKTYSSMLSKHL